MNKQLLRLQEAQSKSIELLNPVLLNTCRSAKEAASLTVSYAEGTHDSIGSEFGKSRETVTRFANDNGGLKPSDIEKFIHACGNGFFVQYLAHSIGCKLVKMDSKELRILEIQEELTRLTA
jgi:hypothetical protein